MEKTEKPEEPESRSKRFSKLRKLRKLSGKLRDLKLRLMEKGVVDHTFLNFIRDIESEEKRTESWKKILSRKDLTPSDCYEISQVISDETLRKKAQQKYVAMASEDDLDDAIKYEGEESGLREMAWQERYERIKKGLIKKRRAREILIDLFKNTPNYRIKIWDVLQWLEPTDKELQSLLILPFMDKMPDLSRKMERLIRNGKKKSDNVKLISRIRNIQERIAKLREG